MASTGCYSVKPIPFRGVEQCSAHESNGQVTAGAQAFSASDSRDVFNHRLNDKGFLPVLVAVHNDSSEPATVSGSDVRLCDSFGVVYRRVPARVVAARFERSPGAEAFLLFGLLSYMDASDYNDKMHADYQDKELADRLVVAPNSTSCGIAYFQVDKDACANGAEIIIPVTCADKQYNEFRLVVRKRY